MTFYEHSLNFKVHREITRSFYLKINKPLHLCDLWGVRLKCYYAFFLVCCDCDTSYIVSVHIQCQASIYALPLCRGHSWRVRLATQETLTPPGHLVSPLICRGPWMSTVVLYCWCHSDSASVFCILHLWFVLNIMPLFFNMYIFFVRIKCYCTLDNLTSVQIWIQSAFVYVICREIYLACLGCYTGNAFVHMYFTCYRNNHFLL